MAIHRIERQIEMVQETARNARDQVQRFLISGQVWMLQARLDGYDREGKPKLVVVWSHQIGQWVKIV